MSGKKYFLQELKMVLLRWSLKYNPFHKNIFWWYDGNYLSFKDGVNNLKETIKWIKKYPELYD